MGVVLLINVTEPLPHAASRLVPDHVPDHGTDHGTGLPFIKKTTSRIAAITEASLCSAIDP